MRCLLILGLFLATSPAETFAQSSGVAAGRTLRFGKDKIDGESRTYSRFEVLCESANRSGQTCLVRWKELKDWPVGGEPMCIYSPQDWGEIRFRWADGHLRSGWLLPGGRPVSRARLRAGATARVVRFHLMANEEDELVFVNELGNIDGEGVVTRVEPHLYTQRDSSEVVPVRCRTMSF